MNAKEIAEAFVQVEKELVNNRWLPEETEKSLAVILEALIAKE